MKWRKRSNSSIEHPSGAIVAAEYDEAGATLYAAFGPEGSGDVPLPSAWTQELLTTLFDVKPVAQERAFAHARRPLGVFDDAELAREWVESIYGAAEKPAERRRE